MRRFFILFALLWGIRHLGWAQIQQSEPSDRDSVPPVQQERTSPFIPQKYLVLDKPGRVKRVRFFVGSEMVFSLKKDPYLYHDFITAIDDSSFTIYGTRVPVRDVDRIVLYNQNWFVNQGSVLLPAAGVIYFLADNLNPVIQGGERFSVSRGSVVVGVGLIATGALLRIFHKQVHKIGKNKRLRVLETF